MKTEKIIEVMNVISAWEAISEWEAMERKLRDQETDPVSLYKKNLTGDEKREASKDYVHRPSSIVPR